MIIPVSDDSLKKNDHGQDLHDRDHALPISPFALVSPLIIPVPVSLDDPKPLIDCDGSISGREVWASINATTNSSSSIMPDSLVTLAVKTLDAGASKVAIPLLDNNEQLLTALLTLPADRLLLSIDASSYGISVSKDDPDIKDSQTIKNKDDLATNKGEHTKKQDNLASIMLLVQQFQQAVSGFIVTLDWDSAYSLDPACAATARQLQLRQVAALCSKAQKRLVIRFRSAPVSSISSTSSISSSSSTSSPSSAFPFITTAVIAALDKLAVDLAAPAHDIALAQLDAGDTLAACLVTDRPDGLYPTLVADQYGIALGLAYSSARSLGETLRTGQGVYQSRTRGLWYKGLSSGAVQTVIQIKVDCDRDTVMFVVRQSDPGFCHLNTRTCFGPDSGLTALSSLLRSRKESSPPNSYTRRLFSDPTLLKAKILEEAHELCDAETNEDIAWEAADLIYFALVRCASAGVSLEDVERQLAKRAMKVTRRPGNAKPHFLKQEQQLAGADNADAEDCAADGTSSIPETTTISAATTIATTTTATTTSAIPAATTTTKPDIKMKTHRLTSLTPASRNLLLRRPVIDSKEILSRVRPIVEDVRQRGDAALRDLTAKFDGVKLQHVVLKAPFAKELMRNIPQHVREAIDAAHDNIERFHKAQLVQRDLVVETCPGVTCSRLVRPIERVGLYVPGGTAVLPSTSLMLGVPAKVAGCSEIVIASPPRKDGTPVPEVVYVAEKVGASTIVLAGGAQAVAAMAYGTESVPKVDKIAGPGNQYVTAGKMILQNDSNAMVSIDMPAGPSELLVIADENSNPAYVASDLLSQAEHGIDSQVVLVAVSISDAHLAAIEHEVKTQGERLPRADIVRVSIPKSYILRVDSRREAMDFSNSYAPEHLILHVDDAEKLVPDVVNAGSVFVGKWSPESCGDYASGTNHTLPTYGYARMYSGVSTDTFVKYITSQHLTKEGLDQLGDVVMTLAEIEGLEAHRNAVAVRLKDIRG